MSPASTPTSTSTPTPTSTPARPVDAARGSAGAGGTTVHDVILLLLLAWTVLSWAGQMHLAWRGTLVNAVDLLFDDGYYYLGVAWNLAHGNGSKFAQPLPTNGYHPLWLLLLAGITALFDLGKPALFCATLTLTAAIKCLGLWLFGRGHGSALWRTAGRLAIFVAMAKFSLVFGGGMETTLFIVFIPLLLQMAQVRGWSTRHALAVGGVASLVFLTRLDALALDAAVLMLALITRRADWRRVGVALVPLVLTAAVYTAVNQAAFDTPLPISGQAKAIGAPFASNLATSAEFLGLKTAAAMLLVWLVVRLTVARQLAGSAFALASLALALAASALYYGLMSGWTTWPWYLYPTAFFTLYAIADGYTALAVAAERAVRAVPKRSAAALRGLLGASALAGGLVYAGTIVRDDELVHPHLLHAFVGQPARAAPLSSFGRENMALLPWLQERYPAGARLAMGDRAGALGYWMPPQFALVQTEGLVGDKPFLQVLRSGALPAYLDSHADVYIADLPRALASDGVLGFVEPVQPRIMTGQLNVLCFRRSDALRADTYLSAAGTEQRYLFEMRKRVECPPALSAQLNEARLRFDGVRKLYGLYRGL